MQTDQDAVIRISRFTVPAEAHEMFVGLLGKTHAVLRKVQGFVGDRILEQKADSGAFDLVTVIEFSGRESILPATAALAELDKSLGSDRRALAARHGIRVEFGFYAPLPI
jgi:antibiotic biosynthesis monooxygenase (ABM) superfamily enzyme